MSRVLALELLTFYRLLCCLYNITEYFNNVFLNVISLKSGIKKFTLDDLDEKCNFGCKPIHSIKMSFDLVKKNSFAICKSDSKPVKYDTFIFDSKVAQSKGDQSI